MYINKLHVNIIKLHIDIDKFYVDIIKLSLQEITFNMDGGFAFIENNEY